MRSERYSVHLGDKPAEGEVVSASTADRYCSSWRQALPVGLASLKGALESTLKMTCSVSAPHRFLNSASMSSHSRSACAFLSAMQCPLETARSLGGYFALLAPQILSQIVNKSKCERHQVVYCAPHFTFVWTYYRVNFLASPSTVMCMRLSSLMALIFRVD
jgi:hypothetical protein